MSTIFGPEARASVYREHIAQRSRQPDPELPAGWVQEPGEPRLFRFLVTGQRTCLDPRFLPEGWEMRLDEQGMPVFLHHHPATEVSAATSIDPRGCPSGWRMLLDQFGVPYFCGDVLGATTYTDPRGLPDEFELRLLVNSTGGAGLGGISQQGPIECFVDHSRKSTQWDDPREGARMMQLTQWLRRDLSLYLRQMEERHVPPPAEHARLLAAPQRIDSSAAAGWGGGVGGIEAPAADAVASAVVPAAARVLPNAVCLAAHMGDVAAVQAYLHGGGDVNLSAEDDSGTLLIFAACAGSSVAVIDLLVRAGAKPNARDRWGCTALSAACCSLEFQPIRQAWLDSNLEAAQTTRDDGAPPASPRRYGGGWRRRWRRRRSGGWPRRPRWRSRSWARRARTGRRPGEPNTRVQMKRSA